MEIVALLAARNEARFIAPCLENLRRQGVNAYLIDNESTDNTLEIALTFLGVNLVGFETLPFDGEYNWPRILRRKQELAGELGASWYLQQGIDEFRLPPAGMGTLAEALDHVQSEGYNAVNFQEFTFIPTIEQPNHDHPGFAQTMRWYYPFLPRPQNQVNAWRQPDGPVELLESAGHRVAFEHQRLYPVDFQIKHYAFLSREHAIEKYVQRRYSEDGLERGWHGWRPRITIEDIDLPSATQLRQVGPAGELDANEPWTTHWLDKPIPE